MEDVKNKINSVIRELNHFLVSLDTLNILELNAKVITAESITGDKISAGAITAEKIEAGAVTAEKITVDELSAISADLGHITAGIVEAVQVFGFRAITGQPTILKIEGMINYESLHLLTK